MNKRILVAAMHHESNSFNPIIAGETDFHVMRKEEIFHNFRENDSLTGIIKPLLAQGYEVIPTVSCRAVPNGEVDYDFYLGIKNEIIEIAKAENEKAKIDAICLSLHGSMRVVKQGEAEGYLLEELRKIFVDIPIFSSLDMHATMTQRMFDNCDGFVGYKCAPHTDCTETGNHAAKMVIAALEDGFIAKSSWVKVPILIAGEQSATTDEPMITLINKLRDIEKQPGIMAASYLMGFPWADNSDSSIAVHIVADNQELANKTAIDLAEFIWNKKDDFAFATEAYHEEESLDVAFSAISKGEYPVFISDSGDNPTAGSSSDCTELLGYLMNDSRTQTMTKPVVFGGIYDPVATQICKENIGQEITLTFGAFFDKKTTKPITAKGFVKKFVPKWKGYSLESDIALFSSMGVDIIITEGHVGYAYFAIYEALGIVPSECAIFVCKLGYISEEYARVCKRSILCLSKGSTNEDLKTLDYKLIPRPIFPLDDNFEYSAEANLIKKGN